ncbi:enoyl-CoA hydratase/isomerase family protein [Nocardioides yefusunii]|uniref:Enoyl-CoA hydratase/isomerase family protein n=1 Tax=Nocardioides yefusunii TaxID=2500546 RepID=A0ABW1QRM3_9ACTN|nr:enoyl-CoA hydratase/isomerase family protein [Nocardioides yefusunii]
MTVVLREVRDQVMYLTLHGPETLNSMTPEAMTGFEEALDEAEADTSLRAVLITASGERAFSVGIDITFLGECFGDPQGVFLPYLDRFHAVLRRIELLPVPVVTAVNGLARAGGFEIILASDLVVVAEEAKIGDIHLQFGVPPGAGASQRAARKLGDQKAKALMLTSKWLDAATAVAWGLALEAVPRTHLMAAAEALVDTLRGLSRPGIAATKLTVAAAQDLSLADGLAYERKIFAKFLTSEGAAEGYLAFVEKREPRWEDADVSHLR